MSEYGHTQATQISNQLGQQSLDMNEANLSNWKLNTLLHHQKTNADKGKSTQDTRDDVTEDVVKVPVVAKTLKTTAKATRAFGVGAYRGATQAETVGGAVKGGVGRAANGAYQELKQGGQGSKLFGEGSVAVKDMEGVEGIIGAGLVKGGGELFAKVAAKGVGAVGLGIQTIGDVENLKETGSIFNTKVDGKIVKGTTAQDVGNVSTLLAGGLDVAAAATGGFLAPIAAAANIFAAVESTIANEKADAKRKAQDKTSTPSTQPPPAINTAAFGQLGLVANVSHNPLDHIG